MYAVCGCAKPLTEKKLLRTNGCEKSTLGGMKKELCMGGVLRPPRYGDKVLLVDVKYVREVNFWGQNLPPITLP